MSKMDLGGGVADAERDVIEKGVEEVSSVLAAAAVSQSGRVIKCIETIKNA